MNVILFCETKNEISEVCLNTNVQQRVQQLESMLAE